MSSFYNGNIKISMFGESHNHVMGVTIDGLKAGLKIDVENIKNKLNLRRPKIFDTDRCEEDNFDIVSGIFNGFTTSAPLTILLYNEDVKSDSYNSDIMRPGQSDYTMYMKTNGYNDYRGGGHNSGRITALIVIVGAILEDILNKKGIYIGSHIMQILDVEDRSFFLNIESDVKKVRNESFPILDNTVKDKMINLIKNAKAEGDSLGGVIETAVVGVEDFIGEGFFNKLDSKIASLVMAIPGVKGIEFGLGFGYAWYKGSEVVDEMSYVDGKVKFNSNNNGGINSGISNGDTIIFSTAVKSTPTISKNINTINVKTKENINYVAQGRHDPCIASRISPVINAVTSIAIVDLFLEKYGYMWME